MKALALPLLRLGELDLDRDEPWCLGGPVGPACAMIAGAWFLTREVELATSRAKFVSLDRGSRGEDLVRWFLPASKTDIEARWGRESTRMQLRRRRPCIVPFLRNKRAARTTSTSLPRPLVG